MTNQWPVSTLRETHRARLLRHFLALDLDDRRLRFGSALNEHALGTYVEHIDFTRDAVLGVFVGFELAGVAHVSEIGGAAEIGLSVLAGFRRRGLGDALLSRAMRMAHAWGVAGVRILVLPENVAMIRLARRHGLHADQGGTDGWITYRAAA